MFPYLLDFGSTNLPLLGETRLVLPTYGLLFAAGALLAWTWFHRRALSIGVAADRAFDLAFYSLLAGIVGAKAALVLVDLPFYLANPKEILGTIRSAGVLLGGVAAGAILFVVYTRRHGLPLLRLLDAIVAPLALAQSVGRLGCFAAGCCWGRPSTSWLAVTFRDRRAHDLTGVDLGIPLVPIQLVQAGSDLALAGILTWLWRRPAAREGTAVSAYFVLYGAARFVIEFWRGDRERGLWFGGTVSTSQLLSLVAVAAGIALYAWRRSRRTPAEAAA